MSKDDILSSYLNIIYTGPNIYGVEMGSEFYFSKETSNLSIAECAFLAGINNSPNYYNPFTDVDKSEIIKNRTTLVLDKMLNLKYINNDEYNEALNELNNGLDFKKGEIPSNESAIYSYHTDALISDAISDISNKKNIDTRFATNYLYMGGLKIYSTMDSSIQSKLEEEYEKNQYMVPSNTKKEETAQSAMVIIDHKTRLYCRLGTAGLGKKTAYRSFNRATQSVRQTGSSMKPLCVLVPGIDKNIISGATLVNDSKTTFKNKKNENYSPKNNEGYLGTITLRRAVESSQNIPFVSIMEKITPNTSIDYLKKMGISTLTDKDADLTLALGGLQNGVSPLEMCGAYSAIANDGIYIEPIFYSKITTADGSLIVKPKQKTTKIVSKSVAFIIKNLLTEPVIGLHGTATNCKIQGIDVAAKTGTTDDNFDRWLCGFTNYYTAVTWYGYDYNEEIHYSANPNPSSVIWSNVMRSIHSGKTDSRFEKPNDVQSFKICSDTRTIC